MNSALKLVAGLMALGALAACVEDSSGGATDAAQTPSPAAQACLRDVTATTNNGDVVLLSESFSQAGTETIIGVGPDRARWRCIGYADGTTGGIQSLTDEGAL
jgi:hypothetical protein